MNTADVPLWHEDDAQRGESDQHRLFTSVAEDDEREGLGLLLKRYRMRIAPTGASLGGYLRVPIRIGKAVTQEEVAEAVGISRQYYATIENDGAARISGTVLRRLADALMMDDAERATLFRLALPEACSASRTDSSIAALKAFRSMHHLMRRLWAATTEAEGLTLVCEHGMMQLALDSMVACTRVGEGRWDFAGTGDTCDDGRMRRYFALLSEAGGPTAIDDLLCYPLMLQPGELLASCDFDARFPALAATHRRALEGADLRNVSYAMASVQSQRGCVGRLLAIHHRPHAFSDIEVAQLSALAYAVSLALSACV
jgi:transcriptional regulator with XRE-family HTH domain